MSTLILCGVTDEESQEFLEAERVLLEEVIFNKDPVEFPVHTRRLKELPAPAEAEKIRSLSLEALGALGLEGQEFQTEFLTKNGFTFLAIRTSEEKAPKAAPAPGPVEKQTERQQRRGECPRLCFMW